MLSLNISNHRNICAISLTQSQNEMGSTTLVCLAVESDDAWRVAYILRALSDGCYWYSVCMAEPDEAVGEPLPIVEIEITNPSA